MNVSSSQIKLATKLHKHNMAKATRDPMKAIVDVPLSTEMIDILERTLATDEDGFLSETVGSHLSMPLSAMSVYCPAAAVMSSKFSAARIPSPVEKSFMGTKSINSPFKAVKLTDTDTSPTTHFNSMRNFSEPLAIETGVHSFNQLEYQTPMGSPPPLTGSKPKIDDAKSRLEVLWLRRRAELAKEDGDLDSAMSMLQGALDEHLGGRDYKKANLSQPVISSDPAELLGTIKSEFFLFDSYAHSMASVVQRWFHKKHTKRSHRVTLITKIFRGFRNRKAYKKYKEMRRQCAVLLQRRFRKHLIRMHALATLIKRWYRLRRIVKEFQKRLLMFRMARRIQRLFRGNRGRAEARLKKRQFQLVNRIQRTARAFIERRNRAWVLTLFHQRFWRAVCIIQTFVRKRQAIERSQIKLLLELSRENIRARKERIVVEEALRMQKIRNSYYFCSEAGRLHLQHVNRQMQVKALSIKALQPALSEEDVLTQRLIAVLEEYDEDGTGNIPTRCLKKVLKRSLIVTSKEQVFALRQYFDPDDAGQVSFNDVIDWYNSPAADSVVEPDSFMDNLSMVRLQLSRYLRKLNVSRKYTVARKQLNTQHASWLSRDTIATFRMTHPPKYQCCQCRRAFVMFTDYYVHFEAETGNCGVLQQRGLFFPKYWVKSDWARQRQIEREVVRTNDEQPYVHYQCALQGCASLAYMKHREVKAATADLIRNAADLQRAIIADIKKADLKKYTVQSIKDLFLECECSSVSDIVAERVTKALFVPFSKAWISDELCPAADIAKWLSKYLVEYADNDKSSFSDNSSSVKLSDFFKQDDPKTSRHHVQFSLESKRMPTISDAGLKRRRARDLGTAQVLFLRALQVDTHASLFAIMEFRARKPRRLSMTDEELQELGLISLTSEHYRTLQLELVSRLRAINAMYVKLYSHLPVPSCPSLRRMLFRSAPAVVPSGDITGDALYKLFVDFGHLVALARQRSSTRSAIGAMVQRELATDLKISKHRLLLSLVRDDQADQGSQSKSVRYENANSSRIIADAGVAGSEKVTAIYQLELQFLFGKYCSIFQDEGIDLQDLDLIAHEFALHIPEADKKIVSDQLDPEGSGFVSFEYFLRWMRSPEPAQFAQVSSKARQSLLRVLQSAARTKYFFHASDVLLARFRAVQRMEIAVREGMVYSPDFSWDVCLQALQDFYRRSEGEDVTRDLNARKYHILSRKETDMGFLEDEDDLQSFGQPLRDPYAELESGLVPGEVPGLSQAVKEDRENGESSAKYGEFEDDMPENENVAIPSLPPKEFIQPTIKGRVYDNLKKLYTLKWREEESEHRVIYRVVEWRATRQFYRNLLSSQGMYNLLTERKLLKQLDEVLSAVGYCANYPRDSPTSGPSIQQALTANFGSSVSSLASGSLLVFNDPDLVNAASNKGVVFTGLDNASVSSHAHSLLLVDDVPEEDEELPFSHLNPQQEGPLSPSVLSASHAGMAADGGLWSPSSRARPATHELATIGSPMSSRRQCGTLDHLLLSIALETTISVFDTDCTGNLDENEVRMLLKCLRCALSEKAFRHTFADNDDSIRGVSLRKLVNHLSARVRWRQGGSLVAAVRTELGVAKHSNLICAAGILVTLQRQLAHKRVLQTVKLSKVGKIVMLRESQSGSSDQTLVVRSQLFAMRQVKEFLRTTQGKIKLQHTMNDVAYSWQHDVVAAVACQNFVATSGACFLNYAFSVHHDGDGVLVTELPHVAKFLATRCGLLTTSQVEDLSQAFCQLRGIDDIRTLSHSEFCSLLSPAFMQPQRIEANSFFSRLGLRSKLRKDAKLRMLATARQQAVKIALNFSVSEVAETNYRCSVLGLRRFIQQNLLFFNPLKRVAIQSGPTAAKPTPLPLPSVPAVGSEARGSRAQTEPIPSTPLTAPADAAARISEDNFVPMEAAALYMLSLGYSVRDLSHDCLRSLVDADHLQGHFRSDLVGLQQLKSTARKEIAKMGTYLESIKRCKRKVAYGAFYGAEFRVTVYAINHYAAVVEKKGAEFLKELLIGVSHCLE